MKPKFQYFECPQRKYKSFKRSKIYDPELKDFVANRQYTNPEDKDLTKESTLLKGNVLLNKMHEVSSSVELPACFDFTNKTKAKVLQ
jgi:hypothetical protein